MIFTVSLTQNKDFLRLYKRGSFVNSPLCVVYYLPNRLPYNRLGITTGKKVGKAVLRNRARRVIRAAYQQSEIFFPVGFDIVVVARPAICTEKSDSIREFLISQVVRKINKSNQSSQKSIKEQL